MSNNRDKMFDLVKEEGYVLKSTKGSHYKFEDKNGMIVVVPFHSREVTKGMIKKIERDIERNKCRQTTQKLKREK